LAPITEKINTQGIVREKPERERERERLLGRPRRRQQDNVEICVN